MWFGIGNHFCINHLGLNLAHECEPSDICPGCENLTDTLRVQSIAVKSSLSRPSSSFPGLLPESDTTHLGPSQTVREPKGDTVKATLPSKVENIPSMADVSNQVEHQQLSVYPLQAMTSTVPFFICSVTAAELVCGERRYKCLGCLRYYDHLASLLEHIQQGWTEGFSCGVFYRKLRSMHESRGICSSFQPKTNVPGTSCQNKHVCFSEGGKFRRHI
uniref:C2H2-type domain-containing protein n=1 Tax=Pygocentrus nattereri TaxID=42514 RepID=A0AAR2LID0_PYGNA